MRPTRTAIHFIAFLLALSAGWQRLALAQTLTFVATQDPAVETLVLSNAKESLAQQAVESVFVESALDAEALAGCVVSQTPCQGVETEWLMVLSPEVTTRLTERKVVVTGYLADATGRRLQTERQFCDPCASDETLALIVVDLVATLIRAERNQQAPRTSLEVRSMPPRANVQINGRLMGISGHAYRVAPGEVKIALSKDGFRSERRIFQVAANEQRVVDVTLSPLSSTQDSRPLKSYASLGIGTALVLGGTLLWVADGPSSLNSRRQDQRRDSKTSGVVMVAAGAGFIAYGGVTLWRSRRHPKRRGSLTVAPTRRGVSLGVAGCF